MVAVVSFVAIVLCPVRFPLKSEGLAVVLLSKVASNVKVIGSAIACSLVTVKVIFPPSLPCDSAIPILVFTPVESLWAIVPVAVESAKVASVGVNSLN